MQHENPAAAYYQETRPFLGMPSSSTNFAPMPFPAGAAPSNYASVRRGPQATSTTYQQAVYQEADRQYPATSRVEHTGSSNSTALMSSSSAHYSNGNSTMRRYELSQTSNSNAPPLPHQSSVNHYPESRGVYDRYIGPLDGPTRPLFASSDEIAAGQGYPGAYMDYSSYGGSIASTSNSGRPRKPSLYELRRQPSSFSDLSERDILPPTGQGKQSQNFYYRGDSPHAQTQNYFDPMPEASSSTHWQPELSPSTSASTTPSLILSPSGSGISSSPPLEHQGGVVADYEQLQEPQPDDGFPADFGLEALLDTLCGGLPEDSAPSASIDFESWLGTS